MKKVVYSDFLTKKERCYVSAFQKTANDIRELSMTLNSIVCAVFSLIARSLFMTTRTYERNRVRTRLQNSPSFPHDTQRVVFNPLH